MRHIFHYWVYEKVVYEEHYKYSLFKCGHCGKEKRKFIKYLNNIEGKPNTTIENIIDGGELVDLNDPHNIKLIYKKYVDNQPCFHTFIEEVETTKTTIIYKRRCIQCGTVRRDIAGKNS